MNTARVAVLPEIRPPQSRPFVIQEVAIPPLVDGAILGKMVMAGVCGTDVHILHGKVPVRTPAVLGHENVARVEAIGGDKPLYDITGQPVKVGDLITWLPKSCMHCYNCTILGDPAKCTKRIGYGGWVTTADQAPYLVGGFAEYTVMPARSLFVLPPEISFAHGAVLMCSSATALHALRKARLQPGETVAVFGLGGLGASAVQLAKALGAATVYAVDLNAEKLALAEKFGGVPVNARATDPVVEILRLTGGRGVNVALELIGLPLTMQQAVRVLGKLGRAALAGLTQQPFSVNPYLELINQEAEIIGVSDHLAREIPELLRLTTEGRLDLGPIVSRVVPLDATAINGVLDELKIFGGATRTVIHLAD